MDRTIEKRGKDRRSPQAEQQHQKDEIGQIVQYCENTIDCRRSQVLAYLGERFNPTHCGKTCDNCFSYSEGVRNEDMTVVACTALQLVQSIETSRPSMNTAIDAFRGSKCRAILAKGFDRSPMLGKGSAYSLETAGRLFHHLLCEEALKEEYYLNDAGYHIPFITLGNRADDYSEGQKKFMLPVGLVKKGAKKKNRRY